MRIAVLGAGGLGGYIGACLARAGEEVAFIARGANLEALRTRGLSVRSRRSADFTISVHATDAPADIGPVDLVVCAVKTYDLDAAAAHLRPLIGPRTAVLPLQNGVDAAERIERAIGPGHALGGVAYVSATLEAPGVVAQRAASGLDVLLGEPGGGRSVRAEAVAAVLQRAGLDTDVPEDIRVALWEKLALTCGGALTALTRLPIGTILADAETREFYLGVMAEVGALARILGIAVPPDLAERLAARAGGYEPWVRTSMFFDLEAGRRLELEAVNGAVVRLGREHGVATPLNRAVYGALHPYATGRPAQPTPP